MSCLICDDRRQRAAGPGEIVSTTDVASHPETDVCGAHFYALYRLLDPANTGDRSCPETAPPSIPRLHGYLSAAKKRAVPDGQPTAAAFTPAVPIDMHQTAMLDGNSDPDPDNARTWRDRADRLHRESETPVLAPMAVLRPWCERVAREQQVVPVRVVDRRPHPHHYIGPMTRDEARRAAQPAPRLSVDDLAGYLHRHLVWIAAQPWVVDLTAALTQLSNQLRTAVQAETGEYRPKPFTDCPAVLDEDEEGRPILCGAPLFPPRSRSDVIACQTCGASATAGQLWADSQAAQTPDAATDGSLAVAA